jgi:hypothetical protein
LAGKLDPAENAETQKIIMGKSEFLGLVFASVVSAVVTVYVSRWLEKRT